MSKNSEVKKTWYSPVVDIYQQARPSYPPELVDRAVTLARLNDRTIRFNRRKSDLNQNCIKKQTRRI